MDDENDIPEELRQHMDDVSMQIGIEYVVNLYKAIRSGGLDRQDAATIIAALLIYSGV